MLSDLMNQEIDEIMDAILLTGQSSRREAMAQRLAHGGMSDKIRLRNDLVRIIWELVIP